MSANTSLPLPSPDEQLPGHANWLAGGALGLLLGLLVGLSTSPVVGGVISGLVALLAGVFGLSEKLVGGLGRAGVHRLAAFGLAGAAAALLGLVLRANGLLSPSVEQQRRELEQIGVTEKNEQKQLLLYLRFGLVPAGVNPAGKDGEVAGQAVAARQSVLYSDAPTSWCGRFRRLVESNAPLSDLMVVLDEGPEAARRAARSIAALPANSQWEAARAAPLYLCAS